jgi:hypothetical protein
MSKRLLQMVLMISLLCGAATQTLACVSMWASDDHACCRSAPLKRTSRKMRSATTRPEGQGKLPRCCEANHSNLQQPAIRNTESSREKSNPSADTDAAFVAAVEKVTVVAIPLSDPAEHSPPRFLLNHSLLI